MYFGEILSEMRQMIFYCYKGSYETLRVAPPAKFGISISWFVKTDYARFFVRSIGICSCVRNSVPNTKNPIITSQVSKVLVLVVCFTLYLSRFVLDQSETCSTKVHTRSDNPSGQILSLDFVLPRLTQYMYFIWS